MNAIFWSWSAVFVGIACLSSIAHAWLLPELLRFAVPEWLAVPWAWVFALWIVPGVAPLEGIVALNCLILLAASRGLGASTCVAAYLTLGALVGLCLTVISKWGSVAVKRHLALPGHGVLHLVRATPLALLFKVADLVVPDWLRFFLGILFTLFSEIGIVPAVVALVVSFGRLHTVGEDFDFVGEDSSVENKHRKHKVDQTLICLVHGNRFNESQWAFGRILLDAAFGRTQGVQLCTVNYFKGPLKRDHHEDSGTVEGCSRLALQQIMAHIDKRGLDRSNLRVIMMGHSLGGVVSTYITERLAADHNLRITDVVSWSAPLAGSALLEYGLNHPWLESIARAEMERLEIIKSFHPKATVLCELQASVAKSAKSNRVHYFSLTGEVDPLVRPDSALLPGIHHSGQSLPFLGHYNIKVSWAAWSRVLDHLKDRINKGHNISSISEHQGGAAKKNY